MLGKVQGIATDIPPLEVDDPDGSDLLVLGWGSTYGPIQAAARRVRARGGNVATAHVLHLNPLPANMADVLSGYPTILVPELNTGQLVRIIRAEYLAPAEAISKVQGQPFKTGEIEREIERRL